MRLLPVEASLACLCGLFGCTRQAYYYRKWQLDERQMEAAEILELVYRWREGNRRFGGRTLLEMIRPELEQRGIKIGRDRFFSLLRDHDLLIRPRRRYVRTTDSEHGYPMHPNLLENLEVTRAEQVWVSDLTYIHTDEGFMYLFLITDAYSRKIMGYHLSHRMKAKGAVAALNMALGQRQFPDRELVHHSDRGVQYCSTHYVETLRKAGVAISMTERASPDQNALAERVNRTIKEQFGMDQGFANYSEALNHLVEDVRIYNHLRPHTSCSGMTPAEAHLSTKPLEKSWKNASPSPSRAEALTPSTPPVRFD